MILKLLTIKKLQVSFMISHTDNDKSSIAESSSKIISMMSQLFSCFILQMGHGNLPKSQVLKRSSEVDLEGRFIYV